MNTDKDLSLVIKLNLVILFSLLIRLTIHCLICNTSMRYLV